MKRNGNTSTIAPTDLAWMAAIFDLRSTLIVKKNASRATPQLVFQVTTQDTSIIQRLCDLTGIVSGYKARHSFSQRRCIRHCPEAHIHVGGDEGFPGGMPDMHNWAVTGVAAGIILYNVTPYMVRSDEEAYTDFMQASLSNATYWGQGSGRAKEAIKRLLSLGWSLPPIVLNNVMPSDIPGGLAEGVTLSCQHEKFTQPLPAPGTRVWCQACASNKIVLGSPRKKNQHAY